MLYPLKFKPRFKERVWGGRRLAELPGIKLPAGKTVGEEWLLSAVQGDLSVVAEGMFAGNDLQEMVEIFMGELVGDHIYNKFGMEFPLLIKLIDAEDKLSVQVHPNDELAISRHNSYGKTEMWYAMAADAGAHIYLGFKEGVSRRDYEYAVIGGTLPEIMNRIEVRQGDAFFIPAGTVHAIGGGILLAEIQQTSDVTYRLYDWDRVGLDGQPRELHTELAEDAVDLEHRHDLVITAQPKAGGAAQLVDCPYFTTNILKVEGSMERDYSWLDSFVIYLCTEGNLTVQYAEGTTTLTRGELLLVPAQEEEMELAGNATVLEVYVK
jgi:mannose-6-phosphate isomerase